MVRSSNLTLAIWPSADGVLTLKGGIDISQKHLKILNLYNLMHDMINKKSCLFY